MQHHAKMIYLEISLGLLVSRKPDFWHEKRVSEFTLIESIDKSIDKSIDRSVGRSVGRSVDQQRMVESNLFLVVEAAQVVSALSALSGTS